MSAAVAQPRLTDGAGAESVWRGCATAGGLLVEPVGWDEERIPTPRSLRLCVSATNRTSSTVGIHRRDAESAEGPGQMHALLCVLCISAVNRTWVGIEIRNLPTRSQMCCATSV
jgi:hypothetical protein